MEVFTYLNEDGELYFEERANYPDDVTKLHVCNLIIKGGGLADIGAVRITDGEIDEEDTDGAFFLAVGGKYNLLLDILLDNTYKIKGVYVGKYKLENEKGVQEEFLCFISGECTFWTLAVETQTLSGLVDMKPKVLGK